MKLLILGETPFEQFDGMTHELATLTLMRKEPGVMQGILQSIL